MLVLVVAGRLVLVLALLVRTGVGHPACAVHGRHAAAATAAGVEASGVVSAVLGIEVEEG